jgi:ParB family chromosome partitioning protein
VAERIVAQRLAHHGLAKPGKTGARPVQAPNMQTAVTNLESRLRDRFATQVSVHHGDKRGRIEIHYYGNEDLERILSLLGISAE